MATFENIVNFVFVLLKDFYDLSYMTMKALFFHFHILFFQHKPLYCIGAKTFKEEIFLF